MKVNITRFWIFLAIAILVVAYFFLKPTSDHSHIPKNYVYKIGYDATWQKIHALDKAKVLTAFFSELMVSIAKEGNFQFELIGIGPTDLFSNLDQENFDAILSGFNPSEWLQDKYLVSSPLYFYGPVLVVPSDSSTQALSDLKGQSVGYKVGAPWLFKMQDCCSLTMVPFETNYLALQELSSRKIKGVIMLSVEAEIFLQSTYFKALKILPSPLSSDSLRFIVKNSPRGKTLLEKFEKGLELSKERKTYQTLLKKWDVFSPF